MASATEIGSRYGESTSNFAKVLKSGVDGIFLKWANDSIEIMTKIITKKARTKQASTLARSLVPMLKQDGVQIIAEVDYWDYVNQGVKGVFKQTKAPQSDYSFKNLGVSDVMLTSFKEYIARTGLKTATIKGKRRSLYKVSKKKGTKTAKMDLIEQAAKGMAIATKIAGIKPMNFVKPAVGAKRLKILKNALTEEMGRKIRLEIIKSIKK